MIFHSRSIAALLVLSSCIGSAVAGDDASAVENSANLKMLVSQAIKYEHAEGVPQDYPKAAALYCSAAKMGYADAQYSLGWMYANGRGVSKDDGIAAQLFAMAAAQGHVQAREMTRLTVSYPTTALPSCLLPEVADVVEPAAVQASYPKGPIADLVQKLAPRYAVDPQFAMAVIAVESGFNVHAKSPKNAQGLMQLLPETAQRFRVKDTFDAEDNIKGGLAYLQWLLAFFKGDVALVAAAYNAGERAVETHRGVPPYRETQDYVRRVTALYKKPLHPFRSDLVAASPVVMHTARNSD